MKNSGDVLNYMVLVTGTMLSLHICILGEFIRLKSENLSDTLYQTNWYELSLKDQKIFLTTLGMTQRVYGLKAAGMYDVNLYTFIEKKTFLYLVEKSMTMRMSQIEIPAKWHPVLKGRLEMDDMSIIYYSGIEMVLWSDIVIMAMIMYCAAELRSITELISRLDEDQSTSERRKILKTVYEMHRMIAEKASRLTLFFWYIYFEQLFMVMTYLCIILFSMQTISMTLFVLAVTVLVILMQIFILCFFGQIIRDSSEAMFDALYMTKWYEMELTDQKNLLIFMIRFFLPIRVQTFGFGVVSIFTFVQICKVSISYATILYTVFV
ncbi:odorant receptor 13a-like [Lutzomyia longipalpis]|uniref:odorant receptor 13a-like n=1 Tax=Lutzomyia longipalpis TaxID=7200 RepID=UPI002483FA80|nr:odorant receptor 13a-like [Lutzomyia longipalpis]